MFASVALLELFARFGLGLGDPPLTQRDPGIDYLFVPGTYHRFGNTIHYNSFSMRADEVSPTKRNPDELRVLVMGDSVLNGGALTDDQDLATFIAQKKLRERLGRSVWVGNVSAGSWGPGNLLAYADRFGWFDADVVIFILSSQDVADVPDFQADLGPDFPLSRPSLALTEGLTRYLPRYLPAVATSGVQDSQDLRERDEVIAEGRALLRALLRRAKENVAFVSVLHHSERAEISDAQGEGVAEMGELAAVLYQDSSAAGVSVLPLFPYLHRAPDGVTPFRDGIHINALGQRLYADAIVCVVERSVGLAGKTCE